MASLAIPSPELKSQRFRPLSTHGLPKVTRAMSPERSHRFSALGFPSPSSPASARSPGSPGPMSPPMSAKSFGTFIDSEPSTPACSPRMDHDWNNSSLVLLRPTSSSSEPSSPTEPTWDMMVPLKVPSRNTPHIGRSKEAPVAYRGIDSVTKKVRTNVKEIHPSPTLPSPQIKKNKPTHRPKEIKIVETRPKAEAPPKKVEINVAENIKSPGAQSSITSPAPFGKLASKMKFMLRRRSTGDKKPKKEKTPVEVDRLEDMHWTEY